MFPNPAALAPQAAGAAWVSPLALRRMIDNLIDNAARYGGAVTVDARPLDRRVEIVVLDDGPGLPVEARETVTAPFERGEASRNRRTGGAARACRSSRPWPRVGADA